MAGSAPLHERLWRQSRDLASGCLEHAFVRGLGDGTLDPEAFKGYVTQDAFFLRSFLGAYCLAAAKCADAPERVRVLHDLVGGVLEELKLHAGYAQRLGIDLERVEPRPATSAYTDFLEHTAWSAEPAKIVAAMTPCMRLYAFLGQSLAPAGADNPYRDWIETYSSPEFEELAGRLEALLDELGQDTEGVGDAYRYAMRCELDFFESSRTPAAQQAHGDHARP
ncbi:MAG: TenA family protein [bacterium]|nr:TenA family protein [bacterium]